MSGSDRSAGEATASVEPVIPGLFPDPSVCRVGEDYYLANSSFEYAPAVPIWHSRDLVSWRLVGNALDREDQFPAGRSRAGRGVYAPTLRHHAGRFWLITTDIDNPRGGHQLYSATEAAGPWSDPVHVDGIGGIDPDLAWDEDGTCLVSYCFWDDEAIGIKQVAIDLDSGTVLDEPRWIWHGTGLGNPEGPHLYRRGSWWHLVIAEGGTDRGHVVSVARSRSPRGPFESSPDNPVLTHRSTRHPVQNVGHADLVERPDGTWAAVHLGVRPRGRTPRYHVNGRETFLAEVQWVDDWPRFSPSQAVLDTGRWSFEDDFGAAELDHRWISPGARPDRFTRIVPGGVEVAAAPAGAGGPSGLFFRASSDRWEAGFTVEPSDAVLTVAVRIDDRHWYGLRVADGIVQAVAQIGQIRSVMGSFPLPAGAVVLGLASTESSWEGPDDIELTVGTGADRMVLGRLDGRYISTEVAGGFTGRVIGMWTDRGASLLRRVRFTVLPNS